MKYDFFSHVVIRPKTRCWIWTGARSRNGYGNLAVKRRATGAHRVSYEQHYGPIPEGMSVLHKCDVRLCVNPEHLFLGTNRDNMLDAHRKGRQPILWAPGELRSSAKLTDEKVRHILASQESGVSLARKYGVTPQLISRVRLRLTWTHVHV